MCRQLRNTRMCNMRNLRCIDTKVYCKDVFKGKILCNNFSRIKRVPNYLCPC